MQCHDCLQLAHGDGIDDTGIYDALDVLGGELPHGKKVIVCGARLVGVEMGMFLAESYDKQVVLVDQLPSVAPEEIIFTRWVLQGRLAEDGVEVRVDHTINKISPSGVCCNCDGTKTLIKAEAVVLALGMTADSTLYKHLQTFFYHI